MMLQIVSGFEETQAEFLTGFASQNLSGKIVLDLGCGPGRKAKLFCDVSEVVGIDITTRISKEQKHQFTFLLADATRLPFKDDYFDAVVSFDVVEHITDDKKFVAEAFRVCKKNGYILMGTPNLLRLSNRLRILLGQQIVFPCYIAVDAIHFREYTSEQLVSLAAGAGFLGKCTFMWVGLFGKFDKGLRVFPTFLNPFAQHLFFIGRKP
jgi:ubiquinone/menaquinone biosynthesis C-methylase UbiE